MSPKAGLAKVSRTLRRTGPRSPACPMSGVLRHRADELGADILAVAPDHLVGAALAGRAAFGENQNKFVENFVTVDMNTHAFGGNIADQAIARRQPDTELDGG